MRVRDSQAIKITSQGEPLFPKATRKDETTLMRNPPTKSHVQQ